MMNEYVQTVMTTNVITLEPENTLADAREIFLTKHIHHVPIVEGKKLVGIISAWDIFKTGKSAAECADVKLKDVMTKGIAALEPGQHLGAAAEVLMEHLFHAVPIVNDDHELLGIITTYDILKYEFEKEYPKR